MSITGKILHTKVREILPGLPSRITPEVLNKTCDDPTAQPFFKWFCSHVGKDNYLSPEDARLVKHIKKQGEWLEGEELDLELARATKDCPELMGLLDVESSACTRLAEQLEAEKDAYKEDTDYVRTLEESLSDLKALELKLDDETEAEESQREKNRIKCNKMYLDCVQALELFDASHSQLFADLEALLEIYANATEKKSPAIVWTQLPLDNFIKQMEMHKEYLGIYVKRHFGGSVEQDDASDDETLVIHGKYRRDDDKIRDLLRCQTNLITSKMDEINAKIAEAAGAAMAAHAADIYSNSKTMIPQSEAAIRMEIATLTSKRDFLEENEELMGEQQLLELVRQHVRLVLTKMLVDDGRARADRRKKRLEKLQNLRTLARERGHGHSDLLCTLMQLQLRRLREIVDFVADGRHYFATEYRLASMRCESMKQEQSKYEAILKSSPKDQNVFNKVLISLLLGANSDPEDLSVATKQYDELVQENERRKKALLGVQHFTRISKLKQLEDEIMSIYDEEIKGVTNSLKPTSYELLERLGQSTRHVRDINESISEIRAKIKDMSRKTLDSSFERETTIMWQRFLTDPEELQSRYDEIKRKVESSHFSVTSDM